MISIAGGRPLQTELADAWPLPSQRPRRALHPVLPGTLATVPHDPQDSIEPVDIGDQDHGSRISSIYCMNGLDHSVKVSMGDFSHTDHCMNDLDHCMKVSMNDLDHSHNTALIQGWV
jgi:hypothetical protein